MKSFQKSRSIREIFVKIFEILQIFTYRALHKSCAVLNIINLKKIRSFDEKKPQ